jgi:demethylmenaquinone methyltransferase/2-methoxy-6-polyprenyl-1,4-benzoquinol methylase
MILTSFDSISPLYDFFETNILKDYQGSLELITKYLRVNQEDIIVDMGGGTGYFAKYLEPQVKQVIVIDPSLKMLQKINKHSIEKIWGTAEKISISDKSVDKVVLINTFHHIPEEYHKPVLEEIYRILKTQGQLFIIEVQPDAGLIQNIFLKLEQLITGATYHLNAKQLKKKLEICGFYIDTIIFPSSHNWKYVVLAKK